MVRRMEDPPEPFRLQDNEFIAPDPDRFRRIIQEQFDNFPDDFDLPVRNRRDEQQPADNNNNELIPERLRIQDLDGWLVQNGLHAGQDDDDNLPQDDDTLERLEEIARFEEHTRYEQSIHDKVFKDDKDKQHQYEIEKRNTINSFRGQKIKLYASDGVISDVPVDKLMESCETIYKLAQSWDRYYSTDKEMYFSLENYPKSSIMEFVNVIIDETKSVKNNISDDAIIDCCLISHYVYAEQILHDITKVLIDSIDTSNCFSLCQLADQLDIPILFERSLNHMINTIGDLENNDIYDDLLTPELRDRISTIKSAIESSINSGNGLYFYSLDEYIAIFAERVQYYKERLAEAKEQQQLQNSHRGSPAWIDAQKKINKQEQRVQTLIIALQEQKKMFTLNNKFSSSSQK